MSAKQAINDKLQGSVATYLRCGGVVNNQIKKSLLLSVRVKKIKIGEYLVKLQAWAWFVMQFARLANTLLNDEVSAQNNDFLSCNFIKYLPIQKNLLADSAINLS